MARSSAIRLWQSTRICAHGQSRNRSEREFSVVVAIAAAAAGFSRPGDGDAGRATFCCGAARSPAGHVQSCGGCTPGSGARPSGSGPTPGSDARASARAQCSGARASAHARGRHPGIRPHTRLRRLSIRPRRRSRNPLGSNPACPTARLCHWASNTTPMAISCATRSQRRAAPVTSLSGPTISAASASNRPSLPNSMSLATSASNIQLSARRISASSARRLSWCRDATGSCGQARLLGDLPGAG